MTLYVNSSPPPDIACMVWLLESATITLPTDVSLNYLTVLLMNNLSIIIYYYIYTLYIKVLHKTKKI
jgi:hypothetical protein